MPDPKDMILRAKFKELSPAGREEATRQALALIAEEKRVEAMLRALVKEREQLREKRQQLAGPRETFACLEAVRLAGGHENQSQFARDSGIALDHVCGMESGKRPNPRVDTAGKYIAAAGRQMELVVKTARGQMYLLDLHHRWPVKEASASAAPQETDEQSLARTVKTIRAQMDELSPFGARSITETFDAVIRREKRADIARSEIAQARGDILGMRLRQESRALTRKTLAELRGLARPGGLTMTAMEEESGIARGNISRLETPGANPSFSTLRAHLAALKMELTVMVRLPGAAEAAVLKSFAKNKTPEAEQKQEPASLPARVPVAV